ncbi:cytochrome P450 [Mycena olivaceomarginata]|nr:cytochrome P450 [Mycena olivaceomarginata]
MLDLFLLICVSSGLMLIFYRKSSLNLPPGPFAFPGIGNLLDFPLPGSQPWLKFMDWKTTFGKIVYIHGLRNSIVVLNDLEVVTDLLSKRGDLCADRPIFTMGGELMGLDRSMAIMSSTRTWRYHRRLAHIAFSPESVKKYYGTQEDIAVLMTRGIIDEPEHFIDHIRLATGRIVMSVTYGISPQVAEHDYIKHAEDTMMMISDTIIPGAYLVDAIPALKHLPKNLPFKTFRHTAQEGKEHDGKDGLPSAIGEVPHSLVSELLSLPRNGDSLEQSTFEDAVIWIVGSMYGAGGETTYATCINCILAMVLYPQVQRIAQQELDTLLGDRLPTILDRESTPYLNALIKETLRWHPSLPLGIPHRSSQDVYYKGYLIPKNTIAIPNVWAISREPDPEFSPEEFIPDRFLPRNSGVIVQDPFTYVFGFGRRVCPGKSLAENSLYIMIAYLIHSFTFGPPRNDDGVEQPMKPNWKSGLTSFPNPFQCEIKARMQDKTACKFHSRMGVVQILYQI